MPPTKSKSIAFCLFDILENVSPLMNGDLIHSSLHERLAERTQVTLLPYLRLQRQLLESLAESESRDLCRRLGWDLNLLAV